MPDSRLLFTLVICYSPWYQKHLKKQKHLKEIPSGSLSEVTPRGTL